jgi:hypothetical protein
VLQALHEWVRTLRGLRHLLLVLLCPLLLLLLCAGQPLCSCSCCRCLRLQSSPTLKCSPVWLCSCLLCSLLLSHCRGTGTMLGSKLVLQGLLAVLLLLLLV